MEQEKVVPFGFKTSATKALQFCIFAGLLILAPYFSNQLITGSLVNALLFISVSVLGLGYAFLLCFIPSLISVYAGLLPVALAPMIPFIIIGNILMVFVFSKLPVIGTSDVPKFWVKAILAAVAKYIFVFSAGAILANSMLQGVLKGVSLMVSWPQLATAIAGACIAFLFLKIKK